MKFKLFITLITLGLALPASADFVTIEQAYEVALSEIRLPRSENGTISYKECSTCQFMTKRVDADTRWMINGRAVSLQKFREAAERVTDRNNEAVTILHHLEMNRVTAVSVYL